MKPASYRRNCEVCCTKIPRRSGLARFCSEACRKEQRRRDARALRAIYLPSESCPREIVERRRQRVAMLAALARLGLPLDLPPAVGITNPQSSLNTNTAVPLPVP